MTNSSTLLNSDINSFARKFLVADAELTPTDLAQFEVKHNESIALMMEQLMLFDKVSFKVYGENIPLAMMIKQLGVKGLENLLEQGALEFLLWTPVVTYNITELPYVLPLQSGTQTSPVHCEPEESIRAGFQWLSDPPSDRVLKNLKKKLIDVYKIPDKTFGANSAKLTLDAYGSDKLAGLGMPFVTEATKLSLEQRKQLGGLAQNVLETTVLSSFGYSSYDKYENLSLSSISFDRIQAAAKIQENVSKLYELENLPDLKMLFLQQKLDTDTVLKFRAGSNSRKFREWLYTQSSSIDAKDITKEYIDSLANSKGFFEKTGGKFVKTISLYTLGTGIGALIGGIPGSVLGGSVAKLIEPVADIGLDMVDTYFLEGLIKGWNPRMYFDSLAAIVKENPENNA